jgi:hypothetical protein
MDFEKGFHKRSVKRRRWRQITAAQRKDEATKRGPKKQLAKLNEEGHKAKSERRKLKKLIKK